MTDLVERLREYALDWRVRADSKAIVDEAATALEAKDAEIAALREEAADWRELYTDAFADHENLKAHYDNLSAITASVEARAETAERKLAEAIEKLKPFAYYYDINYFEGRSDDDAIEIPMRDIRAARAIIERGEQP